MNEEQLRDRLAAVDVPPSRLEMDALVRAGRRRAFRRRAAQATGSTALVAGVLLAVPLMVTRTQSQPAVRADASPAATSAPAAAVPAVRCRMTELPVPPGMRDATAAAVDPTGRYIVGNDTVKQDFRPILWTDGRPRALPVPGKSVQANAVNASGVVVGLVEDGRQEYVFRYENGAYTRLETPAGSWHVYPYPAINAAGDIVINAEPSGNIEGKDSIILLWKAGTTMAVRLPVTTEANSHDITDDGTIVGGMYKNGSATTPYAWDQKGKGRKLELPAGQVGTLYAAQGKWATGGLWPSMTPGLWNLETGEVTMLGKPEKGKEGIGPGTAVNASGWVVAGGTVVRDGAVVELEVPRGQTGNAQDVSDAGLVVGQATNSDNENRGPRLWRC
ncbi:hypothetical protein ACIBSW_28785 [Actinoplanes sp. NPDC049668]|uniref:hypothetical protein n=1 Tax=unclassified Actinoplanes TaxID=2626549 RepID=UPI0033BEA585